MKIRREKTLSNRNIEIIYNSKYESHLQEHDFYPDYEKCNEFKLVMLEILKFDKVYKTIGDYISNISLKYFSIFNYTNFYNIKYYENIGIYELILLVNTYSFCNFKTYDINKYIINIDIAFSPYEHDDNRIKCDLIKIHLNIYDNPKYIPKNKIYIKISDRTFANCKLKMLEFRNTPNNYDGVKIICNKRFKHMIINTNNANNINVYNTFKSNVKYLNIHQKKYIKKFICLLIHNDFSYELLLIFLKYILEIL